MGVHRFCSRGLPLSRLAVSSCYHHVSKVRPPHSFVLPEMTTRHNISFQQSFLTILLRYSKAWKQGSEFWTYVVALPVKKPWKLNSTTAGRLARQNGTWLKGSFNWTFLQEKKQAVLTFETLIQKCVNAGREMSVAATLLSFIFQSRLSWTNVRQKLLLRH